MVTGARRRDHPIGTSHDTMGLYLPAPARDVQAQDRLRGGGRAESVTRADPHHGGRPGRSVHPAATRDAQFIPHAGLVVFQACGHTPNLEEPGLFNAHVGGFLAAVEEDVGPTGGRRRRQGRGGAGRAQQLRKVWDVRDAGSRSTPTAPPRDGAVGVIEVRKPGQPFWIKLRSATRSAAISSAIRAALTAATMIWPISVLTALKMPRAFIFWVCRWLSSVGVT